MENNTKGAGDDYPIIPQPEKEEQPISDREPYFHLSKNEYGRMWLLYKPEGNGRYKCWEPITSEFWNEFEKLLRLEKELASLKEVVKDLLPLAQEVFDSITIDDAETHREYISLKALLDRAKTLLR